MENEEGLYFVALVAEGTLADDVMAIKQEFADNFGSKAALKSPPHITLHMPFRLKAKKLSALQAALSVAARDISPFDLQLQGFGAFEPRVIFVDVMEQPQLRHLQNAVQQQLKLLQLFQGDYKGRGFHPHMTVAFRDLKKAAFKEAWQLFENRALERSWEVSKFCLLKHNGSFWETFKHFPLQDAK